MIYGPDDKPIVNPVRKALNSVLEAWFRKSTGCGMMSRLNLGVCSLVGLFLFSDVVFAQTGGQRLDPSEQREFSAEESGPKKSVAIPPSVLMILENDKGVLDILDSESIPAEKLPSSWFSASQVHLGLSDKPDLIVFGEPPVSGGNSLRFWIFRARGGGFDLVLTTAAHDLIVESTRSKGYRDITVVVETASTISTVRYKFDGQGYIPYKSKAGHNSRGQA